MRFLHLFILFFALCGVVWTAPASAQEQVIVRTGSHDGYTRVVFEWPSKPEYSLSGEGGDILVRFGRAGNLTGASSSIKTLSKVGEPLQLSIENPAGNKFRDFIVANKLIIDIYDAGEAKAKPAPVSKPAEEKAATAPSPVPATVPPPAVTPHKQAAQDFSLHPAESQVAAPVGSVEKTEIPATAFEPHAITLTTITSVGMAAFERSGALWIILDTTGLPAQPQIAGPQKDKFPKLEKIEVPSGVAYRMEIPHGMKAYAEGGGLNWRIVLAAKSPPVKAAQVKADASGKLVWPMQDMRKVISFNDPVVGDKITVVTAGSADQSSGPPRKFVNLQTLNTIIGLAYVAKSDDLTTAVSVGDVSVGKPGGLVLSSNKDLEPANLRRAIADEPKEEKPPGLPPVPVVEAAPQPTEMSGAEAEEKKEDKAAPDAHALGEAPSADEAMHDVKKTMTTEELAQAAQEKPSGNNIYNFPRWEMGGIPALTNNQHVLMAQLSTKEPSERTEDIITLAKLLLANNRGAEALGLIRIALQKVPELEENTEFQSLRGAAFALSGKYDEAITEFSRDSLKGYDDIKYWRAFTLAGLEDWKQAIDVLPTDVTPIAAYPDEIKVPMILSFAEVDLRAGKFEQAEKILKLLEPELPTLALPYASSWNYLTGEAHRQGGEVAMAEEYWTPLVKDGKDDLFRAKAGLSLTKLQLDEKKLKPADAIQRLEGLRYAWRGDELETLINYRLGQMYIDSNEYLKGLTILRNATTLSPGLQLGRDVKAYMNNTFRDIFANDRLKNLSPLEAISIYEDFKDLIPPGDEGNRFVEKLAERLVDSDLLGRAASLLEYQVNNRLKGDKKAEIAIRLAAIRLLDGNPDGALRSLEIAQITLDEIAGKVPVSAAATAKPAAATKPEDIKPQAGDETKAASSDAATTAPPKETVDPEKQRQIYLLKARALSMKKKADEAMAILEQMPPDADVNRLRTDIAWTAGKWEQAALALNDLIIDEDISPKRPLTEYQRDIILSRGIALNLSGDRVALSNLRERYNAQMKDTAKGQMFEIVSRPRRADMIGSREAIESMISEIDMFNGFVEGYTKMEETRKNGGKEVAAPKDAAPATAKKPDETKADL